MTDLNATLARRALDRVRELVQDIAEAGGTKVSLDELRAALGPLGRQPAAPSRVPRPGDTVLIRATVIPPERPLAGDMLAVSVPGLSSPVEMEIRVGVVAEILGPPWGPPRCGDYALDARGDVWRWDDAAVDWALASGLRRQWPAPPVEQCGPLELIVRGGKRYDG